MKSISFYRANEKPYGAFSNLYRRPIVFEGVTYPTSEHAYQAGKARKKEVAEWLMAAPSPALLAMAAHGLYQWDIAPNWSKTKFDRMLAVLIAKFSQHADLAALLLATGDAELVETARVDSAVNRLWGQVNGQGQNMLGRLLMQVRERLREKATKVNGSTKSHSPRKHRSKEPSAKNLTPRRQGSLGSPSLPKRQTHLARPQMRS